MSSTLFPVTAKEQLAQFGLDAAHFRQATRDRTGGREWHGPCPYCGGKDRFIVSNGQYFCRQCRKGGSLARLANKSFVLTAEEQAEIAKRIVKEEAQAKLLYKKNIARLNDGKLWEIYHKELLKHPKELQLLENDGIPMRIVEKFRLGYHPAFRFKEDDVLRIEPALTFPFFQKGICINIRCRILADDIEGAGKYRPILPGLGIAFLMAAVPNQNFCIHVEGEKKALNLYRHGFTAAGLWGVWTWKDKWAEWFRRRYWHNIVIFDGDNEGVVRAAKAWAELLGGTTIFLGDKIDDLLNRSGLTDEQLTYLVDNVRRDPW